MRKVQAITHQRVDEICRHLDLFSRIYIGQYDEILFVSTGRFYFSNENPELDQALRQLRNILIPSLHTYGMNASLGIWGENTPMEAQRAYDIQQCLRYQMAYHRHPEGGYTVNFHVPFLHGQWGKMEHMDEYHEILRKQHCGEYQPGYAIRHPWSCPVVLDDFTDTEVKLVMDDERVSDIIAKADKCYQQAKEDQWVELFKYFAGDKVNKATEVLKKIETLLDGQENRKRSRAEEP